MLYFALLLICFFGLTCNALYSVSGIPGVGLRHGSLLHNFYHVSYDFGLLVRLALMFYKFFMERFGEFYCRMILITVAVKF